MNFTTPTTKEELNAVLRQIDEYYKLRVGEYEEPEITELTLTRLSFTEKSDEAVAEEAAAATSLKRAAEKAERLAEYNAQLAALNAELAQISVGVDDRLNAVYREYKEKSAALKADAALNNMSYSSEYVNRNSALELDYDAAINSVNNAATDKKAVIQGKIASVNSLIAGLDDLLDAKYAAVSDEYERELKKAYLDYGNDALKYNNQITEKEIKSMNAVKQAKAKLRLEYLSLVNKTMSKQELDDVGYYRDVVLAIDGYYYSIPAAAAYDDFSADQTMMYYLGDYYKDMLYKYQLRKNNAS